MRFCVQGCSRITTYPKGFLPFAIDPLVNGYTSDSVERAYQINGAVKAWSQVLNYGIEHPMSVADTMRSGTYQGWFISDAYWAGVSPLRLGVSVHGSDLVGVYSWSSSGAPMDSAYGVEGVLQGTSVELKLGNPRLTQDTLLIKANVVSTFNDLIAPPFVSMALRGKITELDPLDGRRPERSGSVYLWRLPK